MANIFNGRGFLLSNRPAILRGFFNIALWLLICGIIVVLVYFIYLQKTLPDSEAIVSRKISESTKIYDSTGQVLLYDIHGDEKRTVVPWDKISQNAKNAVLASEDSSFYNHKGFDMKGVLRAVWRDVIGLNLSQGGSTITQQLVKNALLGGQKTISRKVREVLLSIELERRFSKDQIFWMYLNQIPYGSNIYGIEAASKNYFSKSSDELSLSEAATLAALIKAPSYYSPYGNHVEELIGRRDFILNRMRDLGYIDDSEAASATKDISSFTKSQESISAPHFVIMVKDYLESKYGTDVVEAGGLKVITTLDSDLQKNAEEIVSKYSKINKEKYRASNSALVAIDPKTGGVKALVGSANYFDVENQGNFNVALSPNRQPGSAFKPFAYATAIQKGFTDATIVFDTKTEFNPLCSPDGLQSKDKYGLDCYHPQNYDGLYRGAVTLRQSLAQSLNVPSVKTLYLAGITETATLARNMGITTLNGDYGLSLVLGGAEVRPIDLVSAYGVFATDGVKNPWSLILRVESSDGTVLEEFSPKPERVLDEQTARTINNILSDNVARAPVFGYSNSLYFPGHDVAAKTGTTQDNRDAWVVGYTSSLAVGVWNGNNDNSPMTRAVAGISASGPMWHDFMTKAMGTYDATSFIRPEPDTTDKTMLDGNYIYRKDPESIPEVHSILFFVNKKDPRGPYPANPTDDPQYNNWEYPIRLLYGYTL